MVLVGSGSVLFDKDPDSGYIRIHKFLDTDLDPGKCNGFGGGGSGSATVD